MGKQIARASLNYVDIIPSPTTSGSEEERPSLNVVMRAQSHREGTEQTKTRKRKEKKTRKRRSWNKATSKDSEPGNERTVGLPRGSCALTHWVT